MSASIDTKIVQMKFDNKDFERGVKQSEKSLEKFKKYLDFEKCEKGLDNLAKLSDKLSFDNLVNNVQKLTDKFTGLGTVSELVLSQIRRGIESVARKVSGLISDLAFDTIGEGKEKFEDLNKNVQTIMSATGMAEKDVYKYMERLNKYTDWTSYSFTEMASNIGKFTSVGIPLKDAEKQMEGIANWAARSGAGINEASRAMYNLSQAMGVGKMTKIDWKSIENAGMATKEFKEQLIQAGVALGTLEIDNKGNVKTAKKLGKQVEVNYQNLAETLSKGWANRQVMERTLMGYYYEDLEYETKGDSSKLLKLTEEELKDNEKLFKNYKIDTSEWEKLTKSGIITKDVKQGMIDIAVAQNKLKKKVDKNNKEIVVAVDKTGKEVEVTLENFDKSLSYGWLDKDVAGRVGLVKDLGKQAYEAAQKCTTLTDVFKAWKDQLSTGWMNVWRKIFGDLGESMELFSAICNKVGASFSHFMEVLVGDGEDMQGVIGAWADSGGRSALWSAFVGEYEGLYEGAYGLLDVIKDIGNLITEGFWMMFKAFHPDDTGDDESWMANEAYRTKYLGNMLYEATLNVKNFIQGIKDFLNETPEGQTKTRFQMIQDVVTGVFSVVTIVFNTIRDIYNFIKMLLGPDALGPIIDDLLSIFSGLGKEINKTAKETSRGKGLIAFLTELYNILSESGFFQAIRDIFSVLTELIRTLIGADSEESKAISIWQNIAKTFSTVAKTVAKVAGPILQFIGGFVRNLKDLIKGDIDFGTFVQRFKDGLSQIFNSIFSFVPNFTSKVKEIFGSIGKVFSSGFSADSINELKDKVKTLFGNFTKSLPENVKNGATSVFNSIKSFFQNIWQKIKNFFGGLFGDIGNVFSSGFSKDSIAQLGSRFTGIFKSVSETIPDGVKNSFGGVFSRVRSFFVEKWNAIKTFFGTLFADVKNVFTSGFSGDSIERLKKRFQTIFQGIGNSIPESVKTGFSNVVERVKTFFSGLWKGLFGGNGSAADPTPALSGKSIFDNIINWVKSGIQKVKDFLNKIFGGTTEEQVAQRDPMAVRYRAAGMVYSDVGYGSSKKKKTIFDTIIEWLKNGFQKLKDFVVGLFSGNKSKQTTDQVNSFVDNIANTGKQKVKKGIFDWIIGWLKGGLEKLKNFVLGLFGKGKSNDPSKQVDNFVNNMTNSGQDAAGKAKKKGLFGWLIDLIKKGFEALKNYVKGLFSGGNIKDTITKIWDFVKGIFNPGSKQGGAQNAAKPKGKTIFEIALEWLKDKIQKVKDFVSGLFGGIDVSKIFKPIEDFINRIFNPGSKQGGASGSAVQPKGKSIFDKVIDWLRDKFEKLKQFITGLFGGNGGQSIFKTIGDFFNNLFNPKKSATSMMGINTNKNIFERALDWLNGIIDKIRGFIQRLVGNNKGNNATVAHALKNLDLTTILLIIVGALGIVGVMKLIKKISQAIGKAAGLFDKVADIPKQLNEALHGGPQKPEAKGDMFLKIAASIAIITAALIFIGNMETGKAIQGAVIIGLIMAGMIIMMKMLKKTYKNMSATELQGLETSIEGMIAIALSIAILMLALTPLAKFEWEDIAQMGAGLAGCIVSFWVMSKLLKKGSFKFDKMAGLLAMAGAIYILVRALLPLANMKLAGLVQMGASLAALLGLLVAFTVSVEKLSGKDTSVKLLSLAAVVGAISILVGALLPLAFISWKGLLKMGLSLTVLLSEIIGFIAMVALIEKYGSMSKSSMAQLAAVAAAIGLLVFSLTPLSLIGWEGLGKMMASLTVILLELVGVIAMVSLISKYGNLSKTALAQLAALAAAIAILVLALIPLSIISWEGLKKMGVGLTVLLLELVGVIAAVALISKYGSMSKTGLVQLIALAGAIVVLVLAMIPLALMKWDQLKQALLAVTVVMLSLVAVIYVLGKLKVGKQALTNIGMLISLAAVIIVLAVAIDMVKNIKPEVMIAFTACLVGLIVGMTAALFVLSKINNPMAMIIAMVVLVAGIALILGVITVMIPLMMNAIASGLEDMMAKLASVAGMFGTFANNMNNVSENSLDAAKRKFEILVAIVREIAGIGDYLRAVDDFATIVQRLGSGLRQFHNLTKDIPDPDTGYAIKTLNKILDLKDKIVGFTIGSFATKLQDLGSGLDAFADQDITTDEPNRWKLLKRILNNLSGIQTFGSTDFGTAVSSIQDLGGALSIFAKGANEAGDISGGVDQKKVDAALDIMESITTGINNRGGFTIPNIPNEDEIGNFPSKLAALAIALTEFTDACAGFDNSNTERAIGALSFLGELNRNLKQNDLDVALRFKQAGIDDPNTMSQFALDIRSLGKALRSFWFATKDIGDTSSAEDALTFFQTLSSKLTKESLEKTKVFKDAKVDSTSLGTFALDITALGGALADFANQTHFDSGVKQTFDNAIESLDGLVGLQERMPKVGGIKQFIEGYNQSLGSLASDIQKLGPSLRDFATAVSTNVDFSDQRLVTAMHNSLLIVNDLVTILSQLGKLGEIFKFENESRIQYYTTYYTKMIRLFIQTLTQEIPDLKDQFGNNVESLGVNLYKIIKDFDTAFTIRGGLDNANVVDIMHTLTESLLNLAEAAAIMETLEDNTSFMTVGLNIAGGVKEGIQKGESDVVNATIEMVKAAIAAAKSTAKEKSPSRVFMGIGEFLSIGLANGIKKKEPDPVKASKEMINNTANAARSEAKIKSPSRVFAQIGEFLGAGLVVGLNSTLNTVKSASIEMAQTAIDATREAFGIHSPSKEYYDIARLTCAGYLDGLEKSRQNIEKKVGELGTASVEAFANAPVPEAPKQFNILDYLLPSNIKQGIGAFNYLHNEADKWLNDEERLAKAEELILENAKKYQDYDWNDPDLSIFNFKIDSTNITKGFSDLTNVLKLLNPQLREGIESTEQLSSGYWEWMNSPERLAMQLEAYAKARQEAIEKFGEPNDEDPITSALLRLLIDSVNDGSLVNEASNALITNYLDGLSEGINEGKAGPEDASEKMMLAVIDTARKAAKINSPSKEMEQLGLYIGEGLKNGIYNSIPSIVRTVLDLATAVRFAMETMNDDDFTPVIRPVLDLSSIEAGKQTISEMLSSPYGLMPMGNTLTLDQSSMNALANLTAPKDYTESLYSIREEVGELRGDLRIMSDSIRQMKFVFNTGAVVAAIGPEMDEYLGQQGYYSVRSDIP